MHDALCRIGPIGRAWKLLMPILRLGLSGVLCCHLCELHQVAAVAAVGASSSGRSSMTHSTCLINSPLLWAHRCRQLNQHTISVVSSSRGPQKHSTAVTFSHITLQLNQLGTKQHVRSRQPSILFRMFPAVQLNSKEAVGHRLWSFLL